MLTPVAWPRGLAAISLWVIVRHQKTMTHNGEQIKAVDCVGYVGVGESQKPTKKAFKIKGMGYCVGCFLWVV